MLVVPVVDFVLVGLVVVVTSWMIVFDEVFE